MQENRNIAYKWVNYEDAEFEEIRKLRLKIFNQEQNIAEIYLFDDFDKTAFHQVLYLDNQPIASCRILLDNGDWKIGRICVEKIYRGQGIGRVLMEEAHQYCISKGIKKIVIESMLSKAEFYQKIGYQSEGDVFVKAEIDHIKMVRTL